ncbi:hypothetical protein OAA53_01885 [Salibacteraceae bacterium]|jgi:hypothetical protein|nr:hypothetical protein [Flavobacteriales bacterium]MDB9701465.1 hypothetical protein [Salibacteraceae bacterium]
MERTDIITIYLGGIRIDEPIATLTDLLVSAVCFYFFYKLHRSSNKNQATTLFKFYFLLMAIATFLGGLMGHAFLYSLSMAWKLPGWITSMFSIMLIERAAINHTRLLFNKKIISTLQVVNIIELSTFMILSIVTLEFSYVTFHSGYGLMFVVLGLEGFLYYKTRNEASKFILIGIGIAAIAALFFLNKWVIHPWFNHLAASHTIMAVAAYFFYLGAEKVDLSEVE